MKIQVDFLFINTQVMVQIDSYYCLNQFGGLFRDVTPLSSNTLMLKPSVTNLNLKGTVPASSSWSAPRLLIMYVHQGGRAHDWVPRTELLKDLTNEDHSDAKSTGF